MHKVKAGKAYEDFVLTNPYEVDLIIWGPKSQFKKPKGCNRGSIREVGIVDIGHPDFCEHGCKIYRCDCCGAEQVIHNRIYGCKKGL